MISRSCNAKYATAEEADRAYREHRGRQASDELWAKSCVPSRHAKVTDLRGCEWLSKLVELKERLGTGCLLGFVGQRGPGKTQMAVELIRTTCERGAQGLYTTAMEVFMTLKGSYADGSKRNEAQVITDFCKPALLVIDETQERGETAWEDRVMTHLIDRRYREEKDTILISNLKKEEFVKSMGVSVISRMVETGGLVPFEWESFRRTA